MVQTQKGKLSGLFCESVLLSHRQKDCPRSVGQPKPGVATAFPIALTKCLTNKRLETGKVYFGLQLKKVKQSVTVGKAW